MKVLITGAGGFIGSHLAELCVEQGYDVRAFVHYNNNSRWGWLDESPIKNELEVIAGDIRDFDSVYAAAQDVEAIIHLAALIGIPYSYQSPLAYIRTNIEGTYNVLQAARQSGDSQVLITSTSETYGTAQYVPIDEGHPAVGQSPYAATKIAADQLALSFCKSFGLPVKIARPFNTYGPRQSARAIIPTVVSQIQAGHRTIKLGNLDPTRDLTFVSDTAAGILSILETDRLIGEATNIGYGKEIAIGDLVNLIAELMNTKVEVISDDIRIRGKLSEVDRLCCDNSKLIEATRWESRVDLKQGLMETIAWIVENPQYFKEERYNT